MRIAVFIVFALVFLTLDTRVMELLRIGPLAPSLLGTLAVFVVMSAPRRAALWSGLLLGLMLDLSAPALFEGVAVYYLVGPFTLGFFFGVHVVLPMRSMVFKRNPLTFGLLSVVFLMAVSIVYVALWHIRAFYPGSPAPWGSGPISAELLHRLLWSLYSGALAIPIGWALVRTSRLWGFSQAASRR